MPPCTESATECRAASGSRASCGWSCGSATAVVVSSAAATSTCSTTTSSHSRGAAPRRRPPCSCSAPAVTGRRAPPHEAPPPRRLAAEHRLHACPAALELGPVGLGVAARARVAPGRELLLGPLLLSDLGLFLRLLGCGGRAIHQFRIPPRNRVRSLERSGSEQG